MTTPTLRTLDPETTTVHETLSRLPGAERVLRDFGLDCCCGGDMPLLASARHHGVDPDRLLEALRALEPEDAEG